MTVGKKIAFVHRGGEGMASYRYRARMPAEALRALGHTVSINSGEADTLVFGKPHHDDLTLIAGAKKEGCRIIVDICDDHFAKRGVGPVYVEMAKQADLVTCPTEIMAARVREHGNIETAVIPEPYEMDEIKPHADGDQCVWFGHPGNINSILRWKADVPKLRIISMPSPFAEDVIPWSMDRMRQELPQANVALFPSTAAYKSNNRIVEAIRQGLWAICEQDNEFRQFLWIGEAKTGMYLAKSFARDINGYVAAAQDYIRDRFSPAAIGLKWAQVV